jgi:hypothetical protein
MFATTLSNSLIEFGVMVLLLDMASETKEMNDDECFFGSIIRGSGGPPPYNSCNVPQTSGGTST